MSTPDRRRFDRSTHFKDFCWVALLLAGALLFLFRTALLPDWTVFSNDGPLGVISAADCDTWAARHGNWTDLNWLGGPGLMVTPTVVNLLSIAASNLTFSKIFAPLALWIAGLCAWGCLRAWRFSPTVCVLGALATSLNSDFLGTAAWGVAGQPIGFGFAFLALAALADHQSSQRWLRTALGGAAVGLCVSEAFDIGALFSVVLAAFVLVQSLTGEGAWARRAWIGLCRLAIVVVCAILVAAAALSTLVGTQIKGVAGTGQDAASKAARWNFATQYSLPKKEALGIAVPGLFGFRHDTPNGGEYWGRAGSDPSWDEYVATNGQQGQPGGAFRAGAGSNYGGILVSLLAAFGVVQSFRKRGGALSGPDKKLIWFWAAVIVVAMLLMFGRFAPFYQFFYALPYVSTIRNPAKFQHIVEWALIILSAYGAEALWRTGFTGTTTATGGVMTHWKSWWAKAASIDRRWVVGSVVALGLVTLTWLFYASSRDVLERHIAGLTDLQYAGMGQKADPAAVNEAAALNAQHSIHQVGRTVLYLIPAVALVAVALSGYFRGARAKIGSGLFVAFMIVDLVPINRPWVVFVNWKVKYESNPVVDFLRERPYEHRVALFPLQRFVDVRRLPRELMPVVEQFSFFAQIYGIEWTQHLFQFYNVQSLDIIQEPRVAQDKAAYEAMLAFAPPLRRWELSNTRYLLGPAAFVESLNQQLDTGKSRFRIALRFDLARKIGVAPSLPQSEQITTVINTNGQLAVIEFTGALPRAKLYAHWQVSTNDPATLPAWSRSIQERVPREMADALTAQTPTDLATLHELAGKDFDPAQTVLLAAPLPVPSGTNQNAGDVKFKSYAPNHIILQTTTLVPSVLLLNDKYDDNWKVWVDGRPTKLLRCNFIMQGVFLDHPGEHRVEFRYQTSLAGLYVSLGAILASLGLLAYVVATRKRD